MCAGFFVGWVGVGLEKPWETVHRNGTCQSVLIYLFLDKADKSLEKSARPTGIWIFLRRYFETFL